MTSDPQQRRREGSRRAQASRQRRAITEQRKQKNKVIYAIIGALAVGGIAVAVIWFGLIKSDPAPVGFEVPLLPGLHNPPYIYTQDILVGEQQVRIPPTSGNHFEVLSAWGFLGRPLVAEQVVHNMEHGGIVLWYQPGNPQLAGSVNRLLNDMGDQCMVAGSYADMSYPVVATAWGRALPLESFDAVEILAFTNAYRGKTGPEAPLCRRQS